MKIFYNLIVFLLIPFSLFSQKGEVEIKCLQNINSEYNDYAPIFLDTVTMLFTSTRPNPLAERNLAENHNIYISTKEGENWSSPKMISYLSNSDNHESTAGISTDRKSVFIYKTFNSGDIYTSDISGKHLNPLKRAPFDTQWQETSACFANNTLYFVSNMPGGKGEHDIYFCTANEKGWNKPENLAILNTDKDENYIFISNSGDTLFFSSKGHNTMGGFDIFQSIKKNGVWSAPTPVGNNINTKDDEICYSMDPAGNIFFSSNRPENDFKGYNIYACLEKKIKVKVPIILTGKSPLVESNSGTVELIKRFIEVEGYKRFIPQKVEVNIDQVLDTNNVIHVSDIKLNKNLSLLDNKQESVIRISKHIEKLEDLSLDEVKKNIGEINYCAVQVGTFAWKTSILEFAKDFPLLADKVVMIQHKDYNRFVMRETFEDLESAIALQKKCMTEYHSVPDTFVAVYDMNNKRILIYFDYKKNSFKMLRPEDQFKDDVLKN